MSRRREILDPLKAGAIRPDGVTWQREANEDQNWPSNTASA